MLERYTRPEMGKIWSLENKYAAWLKVEIAATNTWAELGEVPEADAKKIADNASFTVERVSELEAITHHDVVAFTRTVSESLGEEKKWVHFGLTSTDVVDTAQGYILKQANEIILKDLEALKETIAEKAKKYKYTVGMGRTHGVQAEPTTFGLKLARWYAEINRDIERFKAAAKDVESGKISGAVGTFANVPPAVETSVLKQLGLTQQPVTSQVLPRDLHAYYIATIALIATSIENWATEIRGLQDVALWHERDISHSSAERVILPDATIGIDYMLNRFNRILTNLDVYPETMLKNMDRTYGLIYSQRVLLKLIDEAGLSREKAYDMVQKLANKSWQEQTSFRKLIEDSEVMNYLSEEDLDDAFDYHYHLKHVDEIFEKCGLD